MTSTPIKLTMLLVPEGEKKELLTEKGALYTLSDKLTVRTDKTRLEITSGRVCIDRGYALLLDPTRQTELYYPTPYGEMHLQVQTDSLTISPNLRRIEGAYTLKTAGERIHTITFKIKLEDF